MTYSNTWSDTRPLGSAQANTADDEIRGLRLDIHERMDDLVDDWTADPVVPKQAIIGGRSDKQLLIHGTAFVGDSSDSVDSNDLGAQFTSDSGPGRVALLLPPGVTIVLIECIYTSVDTAQFTLRLLSLDFDTNINYRIEQELSANQSGTSLITSGTIALLVEPNKAYFLRADKTSGSEFRINAVRVTYSNPDSRYTI